MSSAENHSRVSTTTSIIHTYMLARAENTLILYHTLYPHWNESSVVMFLPDSFQNSKFNYISIPKREDLYCETRGSKFLGISIRLTETNRKVTLVTISIFVFFHSLIIVSIGLIREVFLDTLLAFGGSDGTIGRAKVLHPVRANFNTAV